MEKLPEPLAEFTDIRQQVDFLNKSARQMVFESPRNLPRAIALCEIASELAAKPTANQPPYQSGLAESLINLGEFYIQYANYDLALSFLFKALHTLELIDDPHTNATILKWIGVTYGYLGQYEEALEYYLKAQQIFHQTGNRLAQANILSKVGQIYLQMEQPDRSLEFLSHSLSLLEDCGEVNEQAEVLRSLCQVYSLLHQNQRALSCGLRSASLYHQSNDFLGQAQALLSLGDLYRSVHLYTRVVPPNVPTLDFNEITLVSDWGIPNNALDSYQAALNLARQAEAKYDMVTALLRLGATYLEDPIPGLSTTDRLNQAQGYLEQAFEAGKQINARPLVFETHRLLAEVYKQKNNYQESLTHYEKFHALREEVLNRESSNRMRNLEIVHRVDAARKQAEISRLKNSLLQQEMRQQQTSRWELEQANWKLQKQVAEKEQLISDLNAFSHMVAHDLKNPLTNIAIAAGLVKLEMNAISAANGNNLKSENLDRIQWMIGKMTRIINELLTLASVRDQEVYAEPLEMDQILLDVERRLNYLFQETHAILVKPEHWPRALGHAPWVEEVWANYMTNAIYYGGSQPRLEIGAEVMDNLVDLPVIVDEDEDKDILVPTTMIRFWVRDNGDGIPPERQAGVFAPFGARKLAASENPQPANALNAHGHGLGLSIVKHIVEKLNGQVGLESTGQPGQGSLFYFTLPAAPPKV